MLPHGLFGVSFGHVSVQLKSLGVYMRSFYCLLLLFSAYTVSLVAEIRGVVYANGPVFVNGTQQMTSFPLSTGDVLQTKTGGAQVTAVGSDIVVQSDSIIRLQADGVSLDRGLITIATGRSLKAFARDLAITPLSTSWTQFNVTRKDGAIHIFALKNSVSVTCGVGAATIVKEGHELVRYDAGNCGIIATSNGAPAAAKGPILASPEAQRAALAAAGAVVVWSLIQSDDPVSPSAP